MRIPINKVALRPIIDPSKVNIGGVELIIQTDWNPENHQPVWMEVICVPDRLSMLTDDDPNLMSWLPEIEITVGDKVLVKYNAVIHAQRDGDIYFINYESLILKQPDIPINGYVLLEPVYEDIPFVGKQEDKRYGIVKLIGKPVIKYRNKDLNDDIDIEAGDKVIIGLKYTQRAQRNAIPVFQDLILLRRAYIIGKV